MFFYILLNVVLINCVIKEFQAEQNYILIEIFSSEWLNMKIEVAENQVIMSEVAQQATQYLSLYYKIKVGQFYKLDIFMNPYDNYSIIEVQNKDCPQQCSSRGVCKNLQCQCKDYYIGDRCQFLVEKIYNQTSYSLSFQANQISIISIIYQQNDLTDDQDQTKNLEIQSNQTIESSIYLLLPYEIPSTNLIEDKLIYKGKITNYSFEIDYSTQFTDYHIKSSNYSFVMILQNNNTQNIVANLSFHLIDNTQKFQDFILVAILSVISFIILLIIIYIVRRRCQYLQATKMKESVDEQSDNVIIQLMPIVNPVKDQECIICLDSLDNKPCRQTPCKHIMHDDCLKQWIQKQLTCPLCRETLQDIEGPHRNIKSRNLTSNTFLVGLSGRPQTVVQSDRNSVRSMIITRTRSSRLAIYQ